MKHESIGAGARFHFPDATEEEIHDLVWVCTAYPACDLEHACSQLAHARAKSNSVGQAIYHADSEMTRQWADTKAERELG